MYKLIKLQAGIKLSEEIFLSDTLSSIISETVNDNIEEKNFKIEQNKDYQIIKVQEKLAKLNLQREQTTYLPSVSAFYRHTEQINAPDFNFTPPDVIGLQVNIPILSSGMRKAKVQQRKLEHEKITNSKNQAHDALHLELAQTKSDYKSAYNTFKNQEESKILAKKIYQNSLIKYDKGTISSLELTQAQTQYFQALSEYYKSLGELLDVRVKLKKLLNIL